MKFVRGFGWGFQTNRAEGVQMGEGGSTLKPNPQKGEGSQIQQSPSPQTTLNALSFNYRILQCFAAHTKGVHMKQFVTKRSNNKNV